MSVEALGRCLGAPIGGNPKIVLLGLANHAHPDGTGAYPAVDTLAEYAHTNRRTVQRALRTLEDDGFIEQEGMGPRGTIAYRIVFKWEGGDRSSPRGGGDAPGGGGSATRTVPSNRPSTSSARAKADEASQHLPDDFPDELKPHAREAFRLLREVARQRAVREPSVRSLGLTIAARPRRPIVKAAHDWAAYFSDPTRKVKDVVGSYRNWLDKEGDLASVEPLPGQAPPGAPAGANVTPLRRADREQASTERWAAEARAEGLL